MSWCSFFITYEIIKSVGIYMHINPSFLQIWYNNMTDAQRKYVWIVSIASIPICGIVLSQH